MARRSHAILEFDALAVEGGLLAPEWLAEVVGLDAAAQTAADYCEPKGLELRNHITRWHIAGARAQTIGSATGRSERRWS